MWPLDVSIVVLSGVILYLVFSKLEFDDPRLIYSGRFYAAAVPAAALTLAALLRGFASRHVQKSAQLGFLLSVTVHLLLLVVAFQWVIFRRSPSARTAVVERDRNPVRRTVPEHVFRPPPRPDRQPDWTRPADAEIEPRPDPADPSPAAPTPALADVPKTLPMPPLDDDAAPNPALEIAPAAEVERAFEATTAAEPAESSPRPPSPRRWPPPPELSSRPVAPSVALAPAPEIEPPTRGRPAAPTRRPPRAAELNPTVVPEWLAAATPPVATRRATPTDATAPAVRLPDRKPTRVAARRSVRPTTPVGPPPARPTVAIAESRIEAERVLSPVDVPPAPRTPRRTAAVGVPSPADPTREPATFAESWAEPAGLADPRGEAVPEIISSPGDLPVRADLRPAPRGGSPPFADAVPIPVPFAAKAGADPSPAAAPAERFPEPGIFPREPRPTSLGDRKTTSPREAARGPFAPQPFDVGRFDVGRLAPENRLAASAVPEMPAIVPADAELPPRRRLRRTPESAGGEVIAAEPFRQRAERMRGGTKVDPSSEETPVTEAAIETGLAYLSGRQRPDGGWSLQGHGERVLLRSDTAATGLCLLALQGAGYTHRQHQYAEVVSGGLQFLIDRQRTNGDLFVPADTASNQNVALYSHGIASLALCEAYGMTQDPDLREPAQRSIDYVVATQHRSLGGWRYTPQVSADTSVSGWMMMALKSGELAGLDVDAAAYEGIDQWLERAKAGEGRGDRYRYNPLAPDTPTQRHGRDPTPTMTAVGVLMRMYSGWTPEHPAVRSAADYLLEHPPRNGTAERPRRDTYYWYYATQVMFQMGGRHWDRWNGALTPALLETQITRGEDAGSWDPLTPVPDRWSPHAGRLYVTTMNLLNLEVTYRHLPIYGD